MKNLTLTLAFCAVLTLGVSVAMAESSITSEPWGKLPDGTQVTLYTIKNDAGMTMQVADYGALITTLSVPDKTGKAGDVVLGFDTLEGYLQEGVPYFGALIGRYGNRIAKGEFKIGEKKYNLTKNENDITTLHGGNAGFDKKMWKVEEVKSDKMLGLKMTYTSKDGEEGFPGNLDVTICYFVPADENALVILYGAQTDKATPVNLTQHTYFNLAGAGKGTILDHELTLNASKITPVDKDLIPTGEFMEVEGTPFDFRKSTKIGVRIDDADNEQIKLGGGYDHNWVLDVPEDAGMVVAATLYDPASGRKLEVKTLEPGVQFYAGNFLDGALEGKGGIKYGKRFGLCLETQHFPDSPNQPNFPSTILAPGETYQTSTIFRFSVEK